MKETKEVVVLESDFSKPRSNNALLEIVQKEPTIHSQPEDLRRISSKKHRSAFFGIGGGSKTELSRGLPLDVLLMILVMRKLQVDLGLEFCSILLANKVTSDVNEFDPEKVDQLMKGQKRLLQITLEGLNIENWNIFLEDEWEQAIGSGTETTYKNMLERVGRVLGLSLQESHKDYFAREAAVVLTLLQCGMSDIKVGWRNKGRQNGEAMFDGAIILCLQQIESIRDTLSFIYTLSGMTLEGNKKKPPYVLKPGELEHRICFRPSEDALKKIREHGGLSKSSKRLYGGIVRLFEEIVLKGREVSVSEFDPSFPGQRITVKLKAIMNYIFRDSEQKREAEEIWENAFQTL